MGHMPDDCLAWVIWAKLTIIMKRREYVLDILVCQKKRLPLIVEIFWGHPSSLVAWEPGASQVCHVSCVVFPLSAQNKASRRRQTSKLRLKLNHG